MDGFIDPFADTSAPALVPVQQQSFQQQSFQQQGGLLPTPNALGGQLFEFSSAGNQAGVPCIRRILLYLDL
jgi:hypothetical protein